MLLIISIREWNHLYIDYCKKQFSQLITIHREIRHFYFFIQYLNIEIKHFYRFSSQVITNMKFTGEIRVNPPNNYGYFSMPTGVVRCYLEQYLNNIEENMMKKDVQGSLLMCKFDKHHCKFILYKKNLPHVILVRTTLKSLVKERGHKEHLRK